MASKLEVAAGYLLDFNNGQGVGRPAYANYPQDLDANFGLIRTSVNALIDEVGAARLADNSLGLDALQDARSRTLNGGFGRFSPSEARVTFSGANVTVSSGRIWAGQKITVTGATIAGSGGAGSRFVNVNQTGVLALSSTAGSGFYDIAELTWSGAAFTAIVDDRLDASTTNGREPLMSGDSVNKITHRTDGAGALTGLQDPSIRCVGATGTLEDGGFAHDDVASRFTWVSRRATAEGSGAGVRAGTFTELGQLALMTQARVVATATAEPAGTSSALTALVFDATTRREPAEYFTNPWITVPSATFTQPGATAAERENFMGSYAFGGYVQFPDAGSTGPFLVDVVADGVTVFNARVDKVAGGITVIPIAGILELADDAANTIQVRTAHAGAGALNVDARFAFHLIGGPTVHP